jgi:hypothetical protein
VLLAGHLGRPTAIAVAQRVRDELRQVAEAGELWVTELLEEMTARWARGDGAYRLAGGHADAAKEFFTPTAVSRGDPGAMSSVDPCQGQLAAFHRLHVALPLGGRQLCNSTSSVTPVSARRSTFMPLRKVSK